MKQKNKPINKTCPGGRGVRKDVFARCYRCCGCNMWFESLPMQYPHETLEDYKKRKGIK